MTDKKKVKVNYILGAKNNERSYFVSYYNPQKKTMI